MVSELTQDLEKAGEYDKSVLEGVGGTRAKIGDFVELISSYDVAADPEKDRYIVQDDVHQYSVQIADISEEKAGDGSDELVGEIFVEKSQSGFSNEAVSRYNVLSDQDIEEDPGDGALYNDRSEGLVNAADRAPDRTEQEMNEKGDDEILEPDTETGWGVADNL
ncbi:MAG: hypothetical protein ABEK16_01120 [Candidatus Nanohalobium sp.]